MSIRAVALSSRFYSLEHIDLMLPEERHITVCLRHNWNMPSQSR